MAMINATFSRASAAHAFQRSDGALLSFTSDVPVIDPDAGYLFRRQVTNSFRNQRAEGLPPTNWGANGGSGLSVSFVEGGVDRGVPFATYQIAGTVTATTGLYINLPTPASLFFTDGDNVNSEVWVGLDPTFPNVLPSMDFQARLHMPPAAEVQGQTFTPTTAPLSSQRVARTRVAPAGTTNAQIRIRMSGDVGEVILFRLRVAMPFGTIVGSGSSPVLSAPGDQNASTRLTDAASELLSRFGVGSAGTCTIFGRAMLLAAAPAAFAQNLIQIDDGTDNNRFIVRNLAGTTNIAPTRVLAGASADGGTTAFTTGSHFTYAASISAGRLAISVNQGAVQAVTGGPTSGLLNLRFGPNLAGTAGPEGYLQGHRVVPYALSDAELTGSFF